jgi:hypothetical protein
MPLTFYAIHDGAILVAVAKDSSQSKDRWVHITLDQEAFEERMSLTTNPQLANENARLRDFRMARISERPGSCPRFRELIADLEAAHETRQHMPTFLPNDDLLGPSCYPLPVYWMEKRTRKRNCKH